MEYKELIDKITNEVLENLRNCNETNNIRKTHWDNVLDTDLSFGGTLKIFSNVLRTENIDIIIGEFKKGEGLKKHYHKKPTEEIYYILEGEIEINVNDKKTTAKKGDMISVMPETVHWPINIKDQVCSILFILSPREKEPPVIV